MPQDAEPTGASIGKPADNSAHRIDFAELLSRDAIAAGVFSTFVYLFSYYYQRAYLKYYGIGDSFVELDLLSLVRIGAAILILASSIYTLLTIFPRRVVRPFFVLLYLINHILFVTAWVVVLFLATGYSWITLALVSAVLSLLLIEIVQLLRRRALGVSNQSYLDQRVASERHVRDTFVGTHYLDRMPKLLLGVLACFLIVPPTIGAWSGAHQASSRSEYTIAIVSNRIYLLVSTFREGFVAAQVQSLGDDFVDLAGEVRYIDLDTLASATSMNLNQPLRVHGAKPMRHRPSNRVTFQEMQERISRVYHQVLRWGRPSE